MPDIVIKGITYNGVPSVEFKDTNNVKKNFYFTGDADLSASEVVSGKIFYNASGRQVGTGNSFNIDLTGTTWLFKVNPDCSINDNFSVNFTSNNINLTSMPVYEDIAYLYFEHDEPHGPGTVYDGSSWTSDAYRTITITGGNDVDDPTWVAWLLNNAEQQVPLTDLTGTTWLLNSSLSRGGLSDGSYSFNINYNFDGLTVNSQTPTITSFYVGIEQIGPVGVGYLQVDLSGTCSAIQGAQDYNVSPSEFVSALSFMFDDKDGYRGDEIFFYSNNSGAPFSGWTFNNRTMSITGGSDVTDTDLIAWLQVNATQV